MKLYIWENVECLGGGGYVVCLAENKEEAAHIAAHRYAKGRLDNEEFSDWEDMAFSEGLYIDIRNELSELAPYEENINKTAYLFSGEMNKIYIVVTNLTYNPESVIISAIQKYKQYDILSLCVHKENLDLVRNIAGDMVVKEKGGVLKNEMFIEVGRDPKQI